MTYHLYKLVALVEVCHNDTLPFWDRPICADEPTIFPHGVDLEQCKLILLKEEGERIRISAIMFFKRKEE